VDQQLAVVHANSQVEYGLTDAQNSTLATLDQSGKLVSSFSYEPFGQTTTASTYPFQFTGRVPVGGGLINFRARYCDAGVRRFISEDALGLFRGGSSYVFVANNPLLRQDPLGLQPVGPKATPPPGGSGGESCIDYAELAGQLGCALGCAIELAEALAGRGDLSQGGNFCSNCGGSINGPCPKKPDPPSCGPPPPDFPPVFDCDPKTGLCKGLDY
jgi:RHS repeat-associated protein